MTHRKTYEQRGKEMLGADKDWLVAQFWKETDPFLQKLCLLNIARAIGTREVSELLKTIGAGRNGGSFTEPQVLSLLSCRIE